MTDVMASLAGSAETILITLAAGVLFFIVNVGYKKRNDDRSEINGKINTLISEAEKKMTSNSHEALVSIRTAKELASLQPMPQKFEWGSPDSMITFALSAIFLLTVYILIAQMNVSSHVVIFLLLYFILIAILNRR
jgi:hypothetical protein